MINIFRVQRDIPKNVAGKHIMILIIYCLYSILFLH